MIETAVVTDPGQGRIHYSLLKINFLILLWSFRQHEEKNWIIEFTVRENVMFKLWISHSSQFV